MLYKNIFICFFLAMSINALANITDEDFFVLEREMRGVEKITEQTRNNQVKNISFFDKEGFLLRKISYHRNSIKVDERYEYSISDSLLEIKMQVYRYLNISPEETHTVRKFYYNILKQCYRTETYSSSMNIEVPSGWSTNFIYIDNQLQSYETYSDTTLQMKTTYTYSENQTIKRTDHYYDIIVPVDDSITFVSKSGVSTVFLTSFYENGKLTDEIHVGEDAIVGIIWYSANEQNKSHIRFSNFDKRGNWTKSHFITEKGRVLRSKKKIEYW